MKTSTSSLKMFVHAGGRGRFISVSSRPAWSIRASFRTGSKATEKPYLEKQANKKVSSSTDVLEFLFLVLGSALE